MKSEERTAVVRFSQLDCLLSSAPLSGLFHENERKQRKQAKAARQPTQREWISFILKKRKLNDTLGFLLRFFCFIDLFL